MKSGASRMKNCYFPIVVACSIRSVSEMTYKVSSRTLRLYSFTHCSIGLRNDDAVEHSTNHIGLI